MICPNDKIEMHKVTVMSHYDLPVDLDQCPSCGGIWFDRAELYTAKYGEAAKIETLEADSLAGNHLYSARGTKRSLLGLPIGFSRRISC